MDMPLELKCMLLVLNSRKRYDADCSWEEREENKKHIPLAFKKDFEALLTSI